MDLRSSIDDFLSVPRFPARSYSDEEWECKRSVFTQLYRDEGKTLSEVQITLAQEHDFRPTVAMLKSRIRKWDLARKRNQPDMLYALGLALERETRGKDTTFVIRGRAVTFGDVKSYFRRKGILDVKSLLSDTAAAVPTTRIDCHTPRPIEVSKNPTSDQLECARHAQLRDDTYAGDSGITTILNPYSMDRIIASIQDFKHLDGLLYHSRIYYSSVFENPSWKQSTGILELGSLEAFYHHFMHGQSLLHLNHVKEAFDLFGYAFDLIKHLLQQGNLLFLPYLYHLILRSREDIGQEIFSRLFNLIEEMVQENYPSLNSIQHSVSIISKMSIKDRRESSKRVFQATLDRLRVQFSADESNETELDSDVICYTSVDPSIHNLLGGYKLNSAAVRNLAHESDLRADLWQYEQMLPTLGRSEMGLASSPYLPRSHCWSLSHTNHCFHHDLLPQNVFHFISG